MIDRTPKAGEFYRHFKDKLYQVIAVAEHTESKEQLVIYQALYGTFRIYARPLSMFVEETDHRKYPDASQKYRFEKVELESKPEKETEGQDTASFNPLVLSFVEAEDFDAKLEILLAMEEKAGQEDLDLLYEVLDLPKEDGEIKDQIRSIEQYLRMRKKFDGGRLR